MSPAVSSVQIQQADVDAGGVTNNVVVAATSPLGDVPGEATVWQELASVSTVQIGEALSGSAWLHQQRSVVPARYLNR